MKLTLMMVVVVVVGGWLLLLTQVEVGQEVERRAGRRARGHRESTHFEQRPRGLLLLPPEHVQGGRHVLLKVGRSLLFLLLSVVSVPRSGGG